MEHACTLGTPSTVLISDAPQPVGHMPQPMQTSVIRTTSGSGHLAKVL